MKIAFFTFNAYDMLTGGKGGVVGGAQIQQILIGQELAERGHTIYFVERNSREKSMREIEGVQVRLIPNRCDGSAPMKALQRSIDTVQILRELDIDVAYTRVPVFEVIPLATFCSISRTKFVYGFAHDSELTDDPVIFETKFTDNAVYKKAMKTALKSAEVLISQNDFQYQEAKRQFDTVVEKIPNGYPIPENPSEQKLSGIEAPVVLWVSTLRPWKQPEIVFELADELPETMFVIVGGRADEAPTLADEITAGAEARPNVRYEGFVPYEDIDDYYTASDIFLNTSTNEGFPNTFLEAWSHRTPVVSLSVNPSNVLTNNEIGYVADGSVEKLRDRLGSLVSDPEKRVRFGEAAFEYFRSNHSIEHVTTKYERVLTGGR